MASVMKASEFVAKLKDIANNYNTLYVMGCFGAPMTSSNKKRYCSNHSYNMKVARTKLIQAASADTFGFDCVCLIKGVLWGWSGDKNKAYGGAKYKSNGVPDINADAMIKVCSDVSTDFSKELTVGEAVWTTGHIGIYIGGGLAVECTPAWKNKVQITACNCTKAGYNTRNWKKHGKLPYIEYDVINKTEVPVVESSSNTTSVIKEDDVNKTIAANEKVIWEYMYKKIGNAYGTAGLMGNIHAESAFLPKNLQNSFERKLGYTNETYTEAVDNGAYDNFVRDSAGYGLAQWTFWSRKLNLLNYAKSKNTSIGDLNMQLDFLYQELSTSYKGVLSALKVATSVREASDVVLTKFERPANQGEAVQVKRASYGQIYYDKYAANSSVTTSNTTTKPTTSKPVTTITKVTKAEPAQKKDKTIAGTYKVTAYALHIRAGAGAKKTSLGILKREEIVTNYGYYSLASNNKKWLYVKTASGLVGYCSSTYLKKC